MTAAAVAVPVLLLCLALLMLLLAGARSDGTVAGSPRWGGGMLTDRCTVHCGSGHQDMPGFVHCGSCHNRSAGRATCHD